MLKTSIFSIFIASFAFPLYPMLPLKLFYDPRTAPDSAHNQQRIDEIKKIQPQTAEHAREKLVREQLESSRAKFKEEVLNVQAALIKCAVAYDTFCEDEKEVEPYLTSQEIESIRISEKERKVKKERAKAANNAFRKAIRTKKAPVRIAFTFEQAFEVIERLTQVLNNQVPSQVVITIDENSNVTIEGKD